jgi:DNA-binding NarL/FixJ family response regulator
VRLATEEHFSRDGLSGRLRQVLDLLLQGLSEKEVADRLSLSHPTVHSHVGIIYNHFNVCSRAELMAYFIKRQPKLR